VKLRCKATAAGRCKAVVRASGKVIARGSHKAGPGARVTVLAKVTKAGRKKLRHASKVKARLSVAVPGAPKAITGKLTLVR
jgi:hypothetical protein